MATVDHTEKLEKTEQTGKTQKDEHASRKRPGAPALFPSSSSSVEVEDVQPKLPKAANSAESAPTLAPDAADTLPPPLATPPGASVAKAKSQAASHLTLIKSSSQEMKAVSGETKAVDKSNMDLKAVPASKKTRIDTEEAEKLAKLNKAAKEQSLLKKKHLQRTIFIAANLLVLFFFFICAIFVLLWPEHLPKLHLTKELGHVILMYQISILLLLSALQSSFTREFRIASLVGSIIVLCEATIVVTIGH